MKPRRRAEPTCADCGARPSRIQLGDAALCDRCFDVRISAATGWPRLPEPPPPETITGPDRRRHRITYRVWRSPGGVVVEAEEGDGRQEGYAAKLVSTHDADAAGLIERVRVAIRRRIGRLDLERSPHSGGWLMAGDELQGRLVWSGRDEPYSVVVDGRILGWEELGRALEPFEGWEFRLSIVEGLGDDDPGDPEEQEPLPEDGHPAGLRPPPGARIH